MEEKVSKEDGEGQGPQEGNRKNTMAHKEIRKWAERGIRVRFKRGEGFESLCIYFLNFSGPTSTLKLYNTSNKFIF